MKDQASTLINQPLEKVFASATDPAQNHELPSGPNIQQTPTGPIRADTTFHSLAMDKYRWLKGQIVVTAYQPNITFALAWTIALLGIFSIQYGICYHFESAHEGTFVTLEMEMKRIGKLRPFARLTELLFKQAIGSMSANSLVKLKNTVEALPDESVTASTHTSNSAALLDDYSI